MARFGPLHILAIVAVLYLASLQPTEATQGLSKSSNSLRGSSTLWRRGGVSRTHSSERSQDVIVGNEGLKQLRSAVRGEHGESGSALSSSSKLRYAPNRPFFIFPMDLIADSSTSVRRTSTSSELRGSESGTGSTFTSQANVYVESASSMFISLA